MGDPRYDPLYQFRNHFWSFRWAPVVRDQERRPEKDGPYFAAINSSQQVRDLDYWFDHEADELVNHPDAPWMFRFRVWRCRRAGKDQLRNWAGRRRGWLGIILMALRMFIMFNFALCLLAEPEYVAIRLGERTFNTRSIPAKMRTAYLIIALAFYLNKTVQLLEGLAEDRLFSPLVSVVAFNPPAFVPALAYLYGDTEFTREIIGLSFAWLFFLSFLVALITFVEALGLRPERCTAAFRVLLEDHRRRIEGYTDETFNIMEDHPDVSRFAAKQNSGFRLTLGTLLDGFNGLLDPRIPFKVRLNRAYPDHKFILAWPKNNIVVAIVLLWVFGEPKEGIKSVIPVRIGIILISVGTGLGAVLPYAHSPYVLGSAVVWATWCCTRIILLAVSLYQTPRASLDLYGLLLASSLPAIFTVGIPVAVTEGHVLDADWAFVFETFLSTVTTFLLTDMTAPALLKFAELVGLVDP